MGRIFPIVLFLTSTLFISSSLEAGVISSAAKAAKKAAKAAEKAANAAAVAKQDLRATGLPTGQMDILIAGHALSLEASLVSNNLKHFENVKGLALKALA